ncbi:hypothetical protein Pelo_9523 [Pelomyxa schiedti]|nr:hypothetical protein Pelo_9523 [Pelomyxa schiedti]
MNCDQRERLTLVTHKLARFGSERVEEGIGSYQHKEHLMDSICSDAFTFVDQFEDLNHLLMVHDTFMKLSGACNDEMTKQATMPTEAVKHIASIWALLFPCLDIIEDPTVDFNSFLWWLFSVRTSKMSSYEEQPLQQNLSENFTCIQSLPESIYTSPTTSTSNSVSDDTDLLQKCGFSAVLPGRSEISVESPTEGSGEPNKKWNAGFVPGTPVHPMHTSVRVTHTPKTAQRGQISKRLVLTPLKTFQMATPTATASSRRTCCCSCSKKLDEVTRKSDEMLGLLKRHLSEAPAREHGTSTHHIDVLEVLPVVEVAPEHEVEPIDTFIEQTDTQPPSTLKSLPQEYPSSPPNSPASNTTTSSRNTTTPIRHPRSRTVIWLLWICTGIISLAFLCAILERSVPILT